MTTEARAFLDGLGPEFKLYRRQVRDAPVGLSWTSTSKQADAYGGVLMEAMVRRSEVAFALVKEWRGERYDVVLLLRPPTDIASEPRTGFEWSWEPEETREIWREEQAKESANLSAYERIQGTWRKRQKRRSKERRDPAPDLFDWAEGK